jgi:metallophosphoesterase (TIGR03768 family)
MLAPTRSWYQALGNHDHFYIGSFPVDADPTLGLRNSYVADTIWNAGDVLVPSGEFPALFDMEALQGQPRYFMGQLDGANRYGRIIYAGLATDPAFATGAPKVVADENRRSLVRSDWVQAFFNTSTFPAGHGFDLVDPSLAQKTPGFACYSFVPNPKFPLKIIVLDDTQSENDGSTDIHGHGYLDSIRWAWLQAELAKGHAANQLMIIAAHVPIGVSAIGSETEWWGQTTGVAPQYQNAVDLPGLVRELWDAPNLLMWIAGHRHLNAVKSFPPPASLPAEHGFWQVETASLRDFPQQFRTFEIFLNSDYTISIVTTNVDPSVASGTPAATSRQYAIAVQQIVQNNVQLSNPNPLTKLVQTRNGPVTYNVVTMDPSRPQTDDNPPNDPSIQYVNMSKYPKPVQVNGSYNCELFKQLSPRMVGVLKTMFPWPA